MRKKIQSCHESSQGSFLVCCEWSFRSAHFAPSLPCEKGFQRLFSPINYHFIEKALLVRYIASNIISSCTKSTREFIYLQERHSQTLITLVPLIVSLPSPPFSTLPYIYIQSSQVGQEISWHFLFPVTAYLIGLGMQIQRTISFVYFKEAETMYSFKVFEFDGTGFRKATQDIIHLVYTMLWISPLYNLYYSPDIHICIWQLFEATFKVCTSAVNCHDNASKVVLRTIKKCPATLLQSAQRTQFQN